MIITHDVTLAARCSLTLSRGFMATLLYLISLWLTIFYSTLFHYIILCSIILYYPLFYSIQVLADFESRLHGAEFIALDTELTGVDIEAPGYVYIYIYIHTHILYKLIITITLLLLIIITMKMLIRMIMIT